MVQSLNLENDDIGPDGAVYIADMLKENDTLTQIVSTLNSRYLKAEVHPKLLISQSKFSVSENLL